MNDVPLEIGPAALKDQLDAGGKDAPILIDCREPDEWEIARIESARLIPMREIPERFSELQTLANERAQSGLVVYCHHGGRSLRVTQWLRGQGLTRVSSLAGGIDAWAEQIDPAIDRY